MGYEKGEENTIKNIDELISEAQWEVSGNDESKNCQCNCN